MAVTIACFISGVAVGWRLRDGSKYDIVITDNKTAPEIPVGGKMEPIA